MNVPVHCPFCQNPDLFQADFSNSASRPETGLSARGRFWKRIRNDHYPAWPIPTIRRDLNGLHSKLLVGRDHFAAKWQPLTVEILGCDFIDKPQIPPLPLFGISSIHGFDTSYILWHACKITHEEFRFVLNIHWWPSHARVFTVERFDFDSTAARSALNTALSLFAPGRGKPSQYFKNKKQFYEAIKSAVMRRYDGGTPPEDILETEIALELFPEVDDNGRTLRRWLQTSWRKWKWKAVVNSIVDSVTADREDRRR